MAQSPSFDIVSRIDFQEVDNAVNQTRKEISQRYDFKGSKASIDFRQKECEVVILADDEFKLKAVVDILQDRMIKRHVALKALSYSHIEPAAGGLVRQTVRLQNGIDPNNAKLLAKLIKDTKLRVQAQIMEDQVRVSGKSKDDLQSVIASLRQSALPFAMQFVNYR